MIEQLKKALEEKTETTWTGSGNYPFFAELDKPWICWVYLAFCYQKADEVSDG